MVTSSFCAALVAVFFYYYATMNSFFPHDDPVLWIRHLIGVEMVLAIYALTTTLHVLTLLNPLSLLCPVGVSSVGFTAIMSSLAIWVAYSDGFVKQAERLYEITKWLPCWSDALQGGKNMWRVLECVFALTEATILVLPSSLDFACDCVFVFCLVYVVSYMMHCCQFVPGIPVDTHKETAVSID